MAEVTKYVGTARQRTTMAGVSPELSALLGVMNHMLPATNDTVRIQPFKATPELASIRTDEICQVQAMGDTLPLINMDAHSSETDLLCSPEPSETTVHDEITGSNRVACMAGVAGSTSMAGVAGVAMARVAGLACTARVDGLTTTRVTILVCMAGVAGL